MPNRRRRKLSTAMSAVAALAVASPFAVTTVSELTASHEPAPQQHDFVQAAMVTDLPGEIMSALQSSLSQFGVVVPNMSSITGGTPGAAATPGALTATPASLTAPGLTATTPGLTAPTTPVTGATNLTDPTLANPALTPGTAAAGTPGLTPAAPASPATPITPGAPTTPGLTTPAATGLTTPATGLTPAATGLTPATTGLTPAVTGLNPTLTSPTGAIPGATSVPGEVPISGLGGDSLAGTYPILGGDPSLGMPAATSTASSGGLMSELSNAASQLGATQAIDLLKGVVVPSIMQAIKSAGTAPVAAAPAVPAPTP